MSVLMTQPSRRFVNLILQNLTQDVLERLQITPVDLPVSRELEYPGEKINHLFFLESGAASMTTAFEDGRQAEACLFGYEAVIGVSALMGTKRSLNRIYMQIAGRGFAVPVEAARREFKSCGRFHDLALAYVQAQLVQIAQSAVCNIMHHLEQRLSRWLLLCADRSGTRSFHISQEFLAMMMGVQRSSVNFAMNQLVAKGLLEIRRSHVQIVDFAALERQSCECYRVVKRHLNSLREFDSGQSLLQHSPSPVSA